MLSQSDLFKQIIQIFFLLGIVGLTPYYFLWHFSYFEQTSPTNALTELFIALGILVVALLLRDINYILWILLKKERREKTLFVFDLRLFKISCHYNKAISKAQYRSFLLFSMGYDTCHYLIDKWKFCLSCIWLRDVCCLF